MTYNCEIVNAHPYLTTRSGQKIRYDDIRADHIHPEDIIQSLSKLCRFGGHCNEFYSVASHSVLVAQLAAVDFREDSEIVKMALMHDATEAYVADVPRPVKVLLSNYADVERRVAEAVAERFGLPGPNDPRWVTIKDYDNLALYLEARLLFKPVPVWATKPIDRSYLALGPSVLGPRAGEEFLRAHFKRLGIK